MATWLLGKLHGLTVQLIYAAVLTASVISFFLQSFKPPWLSIFATLIALGIMASGYDVLRLMGFSIPHRPINSFKSIARLFAPWALTTFLVVGGLGELWCWSMCHCSGRPGFRFLECPLVMVGLATTR